MNEEAPKTLDQIDLTFVQRQLDEALPEGEHLEFKEALSGKNNSPDGWMSGKDKIGDGARNKILEEVTAFANAYGGTLILGVKESSAKPPVGVRIFPVPRCSELAERFRLAFRDCVEPQLPQLEITEVPVKGKDGVIVFRTGRSLSAPHRVKTTLKCPIRRADRCEAMSMREIQELTLNVARGLE